MRNVENLLSGSNSKIPLFKVFMSEEAISNAKEVLESGFIGQGPSVELFEKELEKFVGRNVLTVNSCTSAIQLALTLSDVKCNDLVLSSPMTCTATNTAILERQAEIRWVDVNSTDGNASVEDVEKIIRCSSNKEKPKALVVVSWGGYPPDLERLYEICKRNDIFLIHDAAHSFGAKINDYYISEFADFTCFSFQAIKHLTTVDGGALVCKSLEMYKRGKLLRWYGLDRETKSDFRCSQNIKESGFKYHMNDLNASIGLGNLVHIEEILDKHRSNADRIIKGLEGTAKISTLRYSSIRTNSFWVLTLLVDEVDKFIKFLDDNNICSSRVHARNDKHECFKKFNNKTLFGLDEFYNHQVSIPCGWWLKEEEVDKIITTCRRY